MLSWQQLLTTMHRYYVDFYQLEQNILQNKRVEQHQLLACYNCQSLGACFSEFTFKNRQATVVVVIKQPFLNCGKNKMAQQVITWKQDIRSDPAHYK